MRLLGTGGLACPVDEGTRAAPREYFQDPKQSYYEEAAYDHAEEISVKQSRSHTSIDPKQFIEELSDSEDWEEPTKIPQNGPVVTSGRPFPPGFIPPPTLKPPTLTVKSSVPVPRVKPPAPAPHPSMEEKSFFRMEYPSVTPKIYYSHPPSVLLRTFPSESVEVLDFLPGMVRSEDELGEKIDRCFADSLLKISGGIAIGIVASVAFFKGKPTFAIVKEN
ncbi:hypothetical protein TELCIR_07849 [Teladorsagia circumcincta]|uniref:MICOS complex subunit MIC10 n=1 Tax=Teladorsagia circumcincta TaxID=45464 RepID=A0A2G9UJ80_TELCI|nr:hypothetical protein TELCIR_07849 [Teladorsagia circumcincta]